MTTTVISGGTGFVGRFIVEALLAEGHNVTVIGRRPPAPDMFSGPVSFVQAGLGKNFNYQPVFSEADNFVHAALEHQPGQYSRGKINDRKVFALVNLAGTAALFKQAKSAGVRRTVFLSDMSVYGPAIGGAHFYETDKPNPQDLYSRVKFETENILKSMTTPNFGGVSIRLSNVYGTGVAGRPHKWDDLFEAYLSGLSIAPQATCEIHGEDVGRAVKLIVEADHLRVAGGIFNAMDFVVDRCDVLSRLQSATGCPHPLPNRFEGDVSTMNCDKLKRMDWRTGGIVKLQMTLDRLMHSHVNAA